MKKLILSLLVLTCACAVTELFLQDHEQILVRSLEMSRHHSLTLLD